MLVGTDVCVRVIFVWDETGEPKGNSPFWIRDCDKLIASNANNVLLRGNFVDNC